jgi:hypothetical protein
MYAETKISARARERIVKPHYFFHSAVAGNFRN